jgi:hypothetical protein
MKKAFLTMAFTASLGLASTYAQVVSPEQNPQKPEDNVLENRITGPVTSDTSLSGGAIMDTTITIDSDSMMRNSGNENGKKEEVHNEKSRSKKKSDTK